ncbi:MAG: hypothetical protein ACFFCK_07050, partial [Promethearchaeota archaeon]
TILWEKNVDFTVHGMKELSPNRFVAFERSGNKYDWIPGLYLECFDAGGTTVWIRPIQIPDFFVPDIIYNTAGGLTILATVDADHLPFVLHEFDSEMISAFDSHGPIAIDGVSIRLGYSDSNTVANDTCINSNCNGYYSRARRNHNAEGRLEKGQAFEG